MYIVGCYGTECAGKIFPLTGYDEENISENNLIQLTETKGKSQGSRVYDPKGISSTLTSNSGGLGGKTGLYFINQYYFHCKKSDYSSTLKVGGERPMINLPNDAIDSFINKPRHNQYKASNTVQTLKVAGDTPLMKVRNGTKKGFDEAGPGDGINLAFPQSKTRRGRVGKGCSQTLDTSCNMGTIDDYRIRRLTPLECFRLQGFPDEMVKTARTLGMADCHLYKMAGNAVTVNVIEAVAKKLAEVINGTT